MSIEIRTREDLKEYKRLDTIEEMRRRAQILQFATKDGELQSALREMCRRDVVFFCENFCWIYEPRPGMEHIQPWHLYPHEIEQLDWMDERFKATEDGLIEKSREMGASWTYVLWGTWHFLFDEEFALLVGSRVEDDIDNKMPDSIFGKFDFVLRHLPHWILPVGFDIGKHRTYMKIQNPSNHSSITGESTNPNFSRSGRYSAIIPDEFSFVDRSYSIWQATADSSPVRFPISTPNGKGNKFGELALGDEIKKLTLHWTRHPEKSLGRYTITAEEKLEKGLKGGLIRSPWYDKECARRTEQEIAQELDISYERSTRGRVYELEWDDMVIHGRLTDVPYDPFLPVDTSWDFGIGDETWILFFQVTKTGAINLIDAHSNSGVSIDHYLKVIQNKPYRYHCHYGDITIKRNELGTGRSVWEIMQKNGVVIRGKILRKKTDAINATKMLMSSLYVDKKLTKFIDSVQNYHYNWDETKQVFSEDPEHDWSSHAMDALSYYALNWRRTTPPQTRIITNPEKYRFSSTVY